MVGERLVSVGRPMLNGDLRVVVPGGGPGDEVAPGETGEILISSPSLAVGIWRDPEATAATFVSDGDRRWWRSRDLGRLDAGGYLYLEGRRDDMIISGGINIMPARVEEVLLAHSGVAECAVVGVPDRGMGRTRCRLSSSAAIRRSTRRRSSVTSAQATSRLISGRASTLCRRIAAHIDQQGAAPRASRNSAARHRRQPRPKPLQPKQQEENE